jgi:hypothetical protein
MFRANVMMAESTGFIHCKFEDLLRFGGKFNFIWVEKGWVTRDTLNYFADAVRSHSKVAQYTACHAAFFIH